MGHLSRKEMEKEIGALTEIGPVPCTTTALPDALFWTCTLTLPVPRLVTEKRLKPGERAWVPRVLPAWEMTTCRLVWPEATRTAA